MKQKKRILTKCAAPLYHLRRELRLQPRVHAALLLLGQLELQEGAASLAQQQGGDRGPDAPAAVDG